MACPGEIVYTLALVSSMNGTSSGTQTMTISPLLRYLVSALIFAGFVVFIETYIGWAKLLAPWQSLSPAALLIAVLLLTLSYWLRALRLFDYFRADMRGRFLMCTKLVLQHNLLNNLLPMRTGELSFPLLMSRYFNVPMIQSMPALLWFRIFDLHTLILIALIALGNWWLPRALVIPLSLVWLSLPWWLYRYSHRLIRQLDKRPHLGHTMQLLYRSLQGLPQNHNRFVWSWIWTMINWLVKLAVLGWVLTRFLETSFSSAIIAAIAGDLTTVLPFHGIAGAGTYEAGVVSGLLLFGTDSAPALQAAVNLHLFVLAGAIISGLFSQLIGKNS